MSEKRVTVWVQRFKDRPHLMLQWLDPETGKRRSKSAETADEAEAERKRADKEYELNHGLHKEPSRMTWERFRELFEAEHLPGRRETTRLVYQNVFNLFERVCSPTNLRSITPRTISTFVAGLRKLPGRGKNRFMTEETIKARLRFLRAALWWAVHQKFIPDVPAFPAVKVSKRKPQAVPVETLERLLEKAADYQLRAFLLCGWLAGLRRNEVLNLEWQPTEDAPYLDFDRDRVWLPAKLVKANEDQWVPLDPELQGVLDLLPRTGPKVFRLASKVTGEPLTPSGVSLLISKVAKAAGVKLSMKSLRRGFGCRYAGRVPAQVLQRLMRHANIKTTMDYYANVDDAVMEAVLGPKRNSSRNTVTPTGAEMPDASAANPDSGKTFERTCQPLRRVVLV